MKKIISLCAALTVAGGMTSISSDSTSPALSYKPSYYIIQCYVCYTPCVTFVTAEVSHV